MLTITDLSVQRGGQWLLEGTSATIQPGQRVGVVGANGAGKSSLFQLIRGELAAEAGQVSLPGGCRIAHMAQEIHATDRSARDFVLDGDVDLRDLEARLLDAQTQGDDYAQARLHGDLDLHEAWSAPRRAEQLIRGLGFADTDVDRPVSSFSGGWRIRLNLAQALMRPSDMMLLDEPTNHLDLDACLWLENWLRRYEGTLLFISHDRDFMDRVATHIMHFDQRALTLYTGNFTAFEDQRRERLARQQADYERQQDRIAEIERFVSRFRAQANKAKAAQSRLKSLERMEKIAPAHVDSPFEFRFPDPDRISHPLLSIRRGAVGYDDSVILDGIGLTLLPGSRMALLGPNGAGKSTLMEALLGGDTLLQGDRTEGEHLSIGYFAQHQLEFLDLSASPFTHLQRLAPTASDQSIRNFLGGFGFRGNDALASIENCSGGEKARLALAIIAWQKPNLLLMDEPTNHLDLEMRQALTEALQMFEGAVVIVSHDRHLLRNTVDQFLMVHEGQLKEYDGDLDDYEQWLAERRIDEHRAPRRTSDTGPETTGNDAPPQGAESADDRKARKRAQADLRKSMSPYRKEQQSLEKQMETRQARLKELEETLADPALYEDDRKNDLKAALEEQGDLKSELESLEMSWLEVSEQLESMEAELETV